MDIAPPDNLTELLNALTLKQRRWVEAYFGEAAGNATKAARLAGYEGTDAVMAVQGYENRRNPNIQKVTEALTECDGGVPSYLQRLRNFGKIANGRVMKTWINPETGEASDVEVAAEAKDIIAANREIGLLAGNYVSKVAPTNAAGDDLKGWTMEQLLALTQLKAG
jgi:hypothetical protein